MCSCNWIWTSKYHTYSSLLSIAYLVKIIFKFHMHCKSFSCRSFIPFLHDLSITGPQKFHIALLLVLLYLSEECFTVVSQTFIYVDLAISSACFRNQLRRQMACVLSQEDIQGLHCKYPGNSIQFLIILL